LLLMDRMDTERQHIGSTLPSSLATAVGIASLNTECLSTMIGVDSEIYTTYYTESPHIQIRKLNESTQIPVPESPR